MDTDDKECADPLHRIQFVFGLIILGALIVGAVAAYAYVGWFGVAAVGVVIGYVAIDGIGAEIQGWLERAKLRRRAREGRCLSCGYDLRGSSDSKVCPECGGQIVASKA